MKNARKTTNYEPGFDDYFFEGYAVRVKEFAETFHVRILRDGLPLAEGTTKNEAEVEALAESLKTEAGVAAN